MARIDLHTHSTCSDGVSTPAALVEQAAANGVQILALTDHDTTAGLAAAAQTAAACGIRLLAGVELGADLADGDAHLLGYFRSVDRPDFQDALRHFRDGREERGRAMLAKLADLGLPLAWERVRAIAGEAAVGRPHVASALVERGYVASVREAFDRYLHTGGPGYATREKYPPEEAIDLIRRNGGVPVLAHPSFVPDVEAVLDRLVPAGLQGLEVFYKNYGPEQIDEFCALAKRYGLMPSGGSDFHGLHDDEREPGDIPFPDTEAEAFIAFLESQWAAADAPAPEA